MQLSFDLWYPIFRKYSIKGVSIPLPHSFIAYLCEDGIVLPSGSAAPASSADQLSDDEDAQEIFDDEDSSLSDNRFIDLNHTVRHAIEELKGSVFIKLNSVAPKDAAWINGGNLKCLNLEQIYLLLKSSTQISDEIEARSAEILGEEIPSRSVFQHKLTMKKWSNLHPGMEFRCFIGSRKLVGATQRDCSCAYEFLIRDKDEIEDTIYAFVTSKVICDTFPLQSFICDLYVDKDSKCWVVDFNEYSACSDTLLFTWEELKSLEGMLTEVSGSDFELRVVETSRQIIAQDAGLSRGPIESVDIASGAVPGFGDWRRALSLQDSIDRKSDCDEVSVKIDET